jgi:hypothetical protein
VDQEKILKAVEDATAVIASISSGGIVLGAAIGIIKGVIGMVVGQTLDGPEYAAAVQRGLDRNRAKIGNRIEELEGK